MEPVGSLLGQRELGVNSCTVTPLHHANGLQGLSAAGISSLWPISVGVY